MQPAIAFAVVREETPGPPTVHPDNQIVYAKLKVCLVYSPVWTQNEIMCLEVMSMYDHGVEIMQLVRGEMSERRSMEPSA